MGFPAAAGSCSKPGPGLSGRPFTFSLFLSPNNSKKDIKVRNAVLRITQLEKEIIALKTSNNSQDNNSVQDDTNSKEENA